MSFFKALFLALVQGLTEFLPVSSSGHLVLFQKLMNFGTPPVFFDVLLHFGTLGSILVFFRKEILAIVKNPEKNRKLICLIFIGSVPAATFGFILSSYLEEVFDSLFFTGSAWILGGVIIVSTFFVGKRSKEKEMNFKDAFFIGLFQALALFPGISRSGTTISSGLFRNLSRDQVFNFSFLLAIPAIIGATGLQALEADYSQFFSFVNIFSMVLAGIIGYLALFLLKKVLVKEKFYYFGFYCLFLGAGVLIFSLFK
ncbi:undecaprenyl-diphosphate phosphatase [Candidatus Microgenomates bacterium]|jgi:undecaprenyl-diphosphatase|nr:MAG: undecaprenyl-diphosphate phosphatase [Candidatus Microgenomates bacterium]